MIRSFPYFVPRLRLLRRATASELNKVLAFRAGFITREVIRSLFVYIIPIALQSYVPAALLLGKMSLLDGLLSTACLGLFSVLVVRAWNRSFQRYESALG